MRAFFHFLKSSFDRAGMSFGLSIARMPHASSSMACSFCMNLVAASPATYSNLTTPSCTLLVPKNLKSPASLVEYRCVPPHASISNSPTETMRIFRPGTNPRWQMRSPNCSSATSRAYCFCVILISSAILFCTFSSIALSCVADG